MNVLTSPIGSVVVTSSSKMINHPSDALEWLLHIEEKKKQHKTNTEKTPYHLVEVTAHPLQGYGQLSGHTPFIFYKVCLPCHKTR